MAGFLNRLSTRMWLLAGLMTVITLVIGISFFYIASYYELFQLKERMPPGVRAELEMLIQTGQRGSDRYYELFDRYGGDELNMRSSDWLFIGLISSISTLVGGSVAFVFARRISQPITAVANAAARVSAGDRSVRVAADGITGEPGELVRSFNAMAAEIESYERERTVLTAGIAHELRTPLTILKGRLHGIIDGVIKAEAGEADRLLRQVEHLSRIVEDLRTLAHADAGALELDLRKVDVGSVMHCAIQDLTPSAAAATITFEEQYEHALVQADPVRLTQIFTNLLTNALKHAPAGSTIEVSVRTEDDVVIASVADQGTGFKAEDEQKLFMPFWRAGVNKSAGRQGSGMGLTLASKLAEAQGGQILAANRQDASGAIFSVRLPLSVSARIEGANSASRSTRRRERKPGKPGGARRRSKP